MRSPGPERPPQIWRPATREFGAGGGCGHGPIPKGCGTSMPSGRPTPELRSWRPSMPGEIDSSAGAGRSGSESTPISTPSMPCTIWRFKPPAAQEWMKAPVPPTQRGQITTNLPGAPAAVTWLIWPIRSIVRAPRPLRRGVQVSLTCSATAPGSRGAGPRALAGKCRPGTVAPYLTARLRRAGIGGSSARPTRTAITPPPAQNHQAGPIEPHREERRWPATRDLSAPRPPPTFPRLRPKAHEEEAKEESRKRTRLGAPVKLLLRVDYDTWLRGLVLEGETCELAGYGPIPVSVARQLVTTGDAFVAAILTKGKSVVGVAHLGRAPNVYQRSALEWLYPTSAAAGCVARVHLEADHRIDWVKTHITVFDHLDLLCSHHHRLKTTANWALAAGEGKRPFVPPEDPRHPRRGDSSNRPSRSSRSSEPDPDEPARAIMTAARLPVVPGCPGRPRRESSP